MNKIVVRQLEVSLSRLGLRRAIARRVPAFWIRRRDEAEVAVENPHQAGKIGGAARIARDLQQVGIRPHIALDVGAGLGQKRFQHVSGRLLVHSVPGIGSRGRKGVFKEGLADALGAADCFESGGGPWFALHHFSEQSQSDADDLPILSQRLSGLL